MRVGSLPSKNGASCFMSVLTSVRVSGIYCQLPSEGDAMHWKFWWLTAALALFVTAPWAQNSRPEAGPFDTSRLNMEPPPAEGVAVRAGRLFDPKSGANLANQVILIKGDRIVDVGPAYRVKIPQ